jgi:hypothetical protein
MDLVTLIFLAYLALVIYAIVHIANVEFKNSCDRVFWFLVVYFMPIVGLILWFVFSSKYIKKEGGEL